MANEREQNRDITLPPDSYLYLVNEGKGGLLTVHRGPTVVNQTGSDQPVRYDPSTRTYKPCSLENAVQTNPRANEGEYLVLENPTEKLGFPSQSTQQAIPLCQGRKVIITGPWSEALWPGQSVTTIEGHRLRSNQYVVAIVYNAEEAQKNWETATVAMSQTDVNPEGGESKEGSGATDATSQSKEQKDVASEGHRVKGLPKPESFAVGTRIIIKGSDISFYIPPTGIEILKDENGKYVREAVTLEQLEYACLIDENGKKDYPHGPRVVFPKPTQVFETDKKGRRKFRPIELNTINGIHLKVTANFEDEDITVAAAGADGKRPTRKYFEGEELFVTGKTLSIYYPREEMSIIEYGQGNKKHFSTVIPKGEGRYIIHRETGNIRLEKGPRTFLADPRNEIPVRRVLSEDECKLWYPGNSEALAYNRELGSVMAQSPSGRSGLVSEGDFRKSRGMYSTLESMGPVASAAAVSYNAAVGPEEWNPENEETGETTGSIQRSTKFTPPRQITLNTKFDGVPRIEVWPGFAVLVVGSEGSRRVEEGPKVVLLEYDEKLGHMSLSTGKPKTTDTLYKTSYLCVQNNQVSDIVPFESSDHVKGTIKISLRVNFEAKTEAEKLKWFSVDNYVKYLTDHVRSMIGGLGKRFTVAQIKADYVNLVRDCILGKKPTAEEAEESGPINTSRPGLQFSDNGMHIVEVEVLDIQLTDRNIAKMLDEGQLNVVQSNIEIDNARRNRDVTSEKANILQEIELDVLKRSFELVGAKEKVTQETLRMQDGTAALRREIQEKTLKAQLELVSVELDLEIARLKSKLSTAEQSEEFNNILADQQLARSKKEADQQLAIEEGRLKLRQEELVTTTDAAVKRFEAASAGLYEIMVSLQRDDIAIKLATATNLERHINGDTFGGSLSNILSLVPSLKSFYETATAGHETAMKNRLRATADKS